MSLLANIDHLAVAAGIESVIVDAQSREQRGQQSWHLVLEGALDLFQRTNEKSIRLVVGKHTIVVQKEGEETVAVVLPTGHAIAKSLRRMIRRMAKKDRGPLPRAKFDQPETATAEGDTPAPTAPAQSTAQPTVAPPAPPPMSQAVEPSAGPRAAETNPEPASAPTPGAPERGYNPF